mgnify:FL=1|tara:strand:- start:12567 stop:13238 length:672 start_codon:yes stop_codon:yes gene_type:complete
MVRPKKISDIKPILTNVAQTSHYQVFFDGLSSSLFRFLGDKGVNKRFITENAGLLCSSASIPGSSLGTTDVFGNFTGVQEKFAHSRIFTELTLEFYVDKDYKMIKLFEHWIDYIASGSEKNTIIDKRDLGYFYRMRYPRGNSGYKCDKTKIVKFNIDYRSEIEYTFFGLFPINFSSTPVQYGSSDVLRASVTFSYERYIAGEETSLSFNRGRSENLRSGLAIL